MVWRSVLRGVLAGCMAWLVPGTASADHYADEESSFYVRVMNPWPVETKDSGGTLLFSDSPEYVKEHGILYSDVVEGDARIFYYHLNETGRPGKAAVVLKNERDRRVAVKILRSAISRPSSIYPQVGKETELGYMSMPQREKTFSIEGGGGRVLSSEMNDVLLQPGELVSGIYDIRASSPVRVTVVFCSEYSDPVSFAETAKVLPCDEYALRGTFQGMNRTITAKRIYDPQKDGMVYIPIGDNKRDVYKMGIDATDGSAVQNYGNYGVRYRFEIPTKGKSPTHFLLSPLGGVYAGAVRVKHKEGIRLVETPKGRLYFGEKTPFGLPERYDGRMVFSRDFEFADLGLYPPYKGTAIEYSPPGASNLPALLILAPGEEKKERKTGETIVRTER